jgi:hypothetical protein
MKKEEYKIGDRVKIVSLSNHEGSPFIGKIGHEGIISKISDGLYTLEPHCVGSYWPAYCLELVECIPNYQIY